MKLRYLASFALLVTVCPTLMAGDEWRKKPAEQWTEDEARQVLNDSPWAKRVKVRYLETSGGRRSGGTSPMPGGSPIPGGSPVPGGDRRWAALQSLVAAVAADPGECARRRRSWSDGRAPRRSVLPWPNSESSARPAWSASKDSYVIAALAVPEMGQDIGDMDDPSTLGRLRDGARLLIGNQRSIIPDRVQASRSDEGLMVFFIFPKEKVGPLGDEKLKLLARIGPAQLSAEFKPKDMNLAGSARRICERV